jgi:hypothetical protein
MNDLPPAVVSDLIALGSRDTSRSGERDQLLARLKPFGRVNCLGWDRWSEAADRLREAELRNLVRGLTTAELELGWCGGSVSGIISVYRSYESRFPDRADELADWVLARSENPYVPFGTMRAGARSVAEYRAYLSAKSRWHDESKQEQEDARRHKHIRAAVRNRLAQERRLLQAAHSRARVELTSQLQDLPIKERLEHMAWDDFHSLTFYPASYAKFDRRAFEQLDVGTRKRLIDKIAARRKGVWKKLYERLTEPAK